MPSGKRSTFSATARGIIIGIGLSYLLSVLNGGSFAPSKLHGSFSVVSGTGSVPSTKSLMLQLQRSRKSNRFLEEEEIEISKSKHHKEEEEEEIDENLVDTSIVFIIILLILMTIAFEVMEELIEESSPRDLRPIVASLFAELTVLGFLSVCTFVITRTPFPYRLSERLFGEEEFLTEIFELTHMSLFFVMIFFVAQVLILLKDSIKTENRWLVLDRACQYLRYNGESRNERTEPENLDIFIGLREEFLLERSLQPPFEPAPKEHRVPEDFSFGRYLAISMGLTVSHAVHVEILSWVAFIILTLGFYFVMLALENELVVIAWFWVGLGWFSFLFLVVVFERYLNNIAKALAAPSPEDTAQLSAGEQDALLPNTNSTNLPAWCQIDLDQYISKRSWFKRLVCPKTPNRQDTLFWFEKKGSHVHLLILQINLILMGVYGALLILTFYPAVLSDCSGTVFVAYFVVSLLPAVGIMARIRWIVALMSVVGSIGALRRPQVVSEVIRKEKTQLVVRAFLVLERMHRLSMQEDIDDVYASAAGEHRKLTPLEVAEVGATFDAFDRSGDGMMSISELDRVMQNLGGASDERLQKMLQSLDVNGDGQVSKAEFLQWYGRHMLREENEPLHERAHALFHMFDENDSGAITIGEFKRTLDAFSIGFTVDEVGQIVNELDEDGNIMIGFEEFHELLEKYYPKELEEE